MMETQYDEGFIYSTYILHWIDDGTKFGVVEDQLGNQYKIFCAVWQKREGWQRREELIQYRCCKETLSDSASKKRCKALVKRYNERDGTYTFRLESLHNKHAPEKRKINEEINPGKMFFLQYSYF